MPPRSIPSRSISTHTDHVHVYHSGHVRGKVLAAVHPSAPTPLSSHPAGDDSSLEHLRVPRLEESAVVANDLAPLRANQAAPPNPSPAPRVRTAACYCFLRCYPSAVTCPAHVRATSKAYERATAHRKWGWGLEGLVGTGSGSRDHTARRAATGGGRRDVAAAGLDRL